MFKFVPETREWTVLYNFDLGIFNYGLTEQNGMLVGSANDGGGGGLCRLGCGTVYSIDQDTGAYTQLSAFTGGKNGNQPNLPIYVDGAFYGSTGAGGDPGCAGARCGTIYKLTPNGSSYDNTTIYRFKNKNDTRYPDSQLVYHDGALYGTSGNDIGKHGCSDDGGGCGTIFKIDRATGAETILYRFTGGDDGGVPNSLTYHDGALYGTTQLGADKAHCRLYGCGTVFKFILGKPNKP